MSEKPLTEPRRRRVPAGLGAAAVWVAAWQLASMVAGSGLLLAGPLDTVAALARLVPTHPFWEQVAFSSLRIVGGAVAGYLLAFALAAAAWRWRAVRALAQPPLAAIKGTPVACVVVLLLIWFGSRNVSAVAVLLMVLPGVYFPVLTGLDELDHGQRELFDAFGAGRATSALALVWPGILPYVTAASRTVLGMSWKAGVAAELIGVPDGSIGECIYQAKLLLETADLFAWTIVVVLVSWVFERAVLALLQGSWPAAGRLAAQSGRSRARGESPLDGACGAPDGRIGAGEAGSGDVADGSSGDTGTGGRADAASAPAGAPPESVPTLNARQLVIGYGGEPVCAPLSFSLETGGALCLTAPSGTGKTTLLCTLAGLQKPIGGRLIFGWDGPTSARPAPVRPACGITFQDARLLEDLTAVENVLLFAARRVDAAQAHKSLEELLPAGALDVPVSELSGGQRRRVELARAFAAPGPLVLLDEPFAGLDADAHRRALTFVRRHGAERAVVLATHDPEDAVALDAQVLALREMLRERDRA